MSNSTELYAVADCKSNPFRPERDEYRKQGVEAEASLLNPNGIGNPFRWTPDCGMPEGPREIWARVQGRSLLWLIRWPC